jgi:hypothetical protein
MESFTNSAEDDIKAVMADFPLLIEDSVYYCGFNSPKSFGRNSYLIRDLEGNWLIDSPKFISSNGYCRDMGSEFSCLRVQWHNR